MRTFKTVVIESTHNNSTRVITKRQYDKEWKFMFIEEKPDFYNIEYIYRDDETRFTMKDKSSWRTSYRAFEQSVDGLLYELIVDEKGRILGAYNTDRGEQYRLKQEAQDEPHKKEQQERREHHIRYLIEQQKNLEENLNEKNSSSEKIVEALEIRKSDKERLRHLKNRLLRKTVSNHEIYEVVDEINILKHYINQLNLLIKRLRKGEHFQDMKPYQPFVIENK